MISNSNQSIIMDEARPLVATSMRPVSCLFLLQFLYPGLYMIGYGRGKIILKFPPFCRLNEENQERENSKHQMKTKTITFLFSFDF